MLLLRLSYVRGPDLTAGLHFSIRAQVGEFQLGLVCVGISGGNLSRLPGSTRVGTWVPTLPRSLRSTFVSGETVKGTCVSVEAHPRGGGRVAVTGQKESSSRSGEVQIYRESE